MSVDGLPDDDRHRQVFLDNLVSGSAAHLQLAPGITVASSATQIRVTHINGCFMAWPFWLCGSAKGGAR